MKKIFFVIIFLLHTICTNTYPQQKKYYFYNPKNNFGSELWFNPLTVVINGSYDILRNGGFSNKDVFNLPYKAGFDNVLRNISHPIKNIELFGWREFLRHECLNISLNTYKSQFVPNFSHHIIGNGMQYVKLAEWYDYHNVKYPYLCSFLTTTLYQFMNEVIENGEYVGTNVDPISDMLIFNPLGFIVFSFDFVKRFFSKTLQMNDWSLQYFINPENRFIENAGQQFVVKYKIPFTKNYSAFLYWGIYGIGGISYRYNKIHNFSIGVGTVVNMLHEKRLKWSRVLTPALDGAFGFFYDKNNSLMSSVIITYPRLFNVRIDIFPGFIRKKWFIPGVFIGFGEWDHFAIGLTTAYIPVGVITGIYN